MRLLNCCWILLLSAGLAIQSACVTTQSGPTPVSRKPSAEVEALVRAAQRGDLAKVTSLLNNGTDINGQDGRGGTALHGAVRYNRHKIAAHLIDNGADAKLEDDGGLSPVLLASAYGQNESIDVLVSRGIDLNVVNEKGQFPLLLAAKGDYASTIELLVQRGASPDLVNSSGISALLLACEKENLETVESLLRNGADPNTADAEGWTPLMVSVRHSSSSTVEKLIGRGASLEAENSSGMTPLLIAIANDDFDMARYLVSKDATTTGREIHPYLAGIADYLHMQYLKDEVTEERLTELLTTVCGQMNVAVHDYKERLDDKKGEASGRNFRSGLFIGGSVVLLAAVGASPIPAAWSNDSVKHEIELAEKRLRRCTLIKAQCESVIEKLTQLEDRLSNTESALNDLTKGFVTAE